MLENDKDADDLLRDDDIWTLTESAPSGVLLPEEYSPKSSEILTENQHKRNLLFPPAIGTCGCLSYADADTWLLSCFGVRETEDTDRQSVFRLERSQKCVDTRNIAFNWFVWTLIQEPSSTIFALKNI